MEASIANLKAHLSEVLSSVEKGEPCMVLRHNKPVARIVPLEQKHVNSTKAGCAKGTVKILGDLTEPLMPAEDWEMLK